MLNLFNNKLLSRRANASKKQADDDGMDVAEIDFKKVEDFWSTDVPLTSSFLQHVHETDHDEKSHHRFIIDPNNIYKIYWDVLLCMFIIYSVIAIPWRIGFSHEPSVGYIAFDLIIDVFFFLDIILNFCVGYFDTNTDEYVTDRCSIAVNYFKGWFTIDVLSTIPFDFFASGDSNLFIVRAIRILRLFRLLKIYRFANINEFLIQRSINPTIVSLGGLLLQILFIAHLFACFWHFMAITSDDSITWINNPDGNFNFVNVNDNERYIASMYYIIVTMLTVGYGDIHSCNKNERAFSIVTMLTGGIIFGTLISKVARIIQKRNPQAKAYKEKMDELKAFLEMKQLDKHTEFKRRIKDAYAYFLTKSSAIIENIDILDDLPEENLNELMKEIYKEHLEQFLSIFDHHYIKGSHVAMDQVVREILQHTLPYQAARGEPIYEYDGICTDISVVTKGLIYLVEPKNVATTGNEYPIISGQCNPTEAQYFGDFEYFRETCCKISYIAVNTCSMLAISYLTLDKVFRKHPDYKRRFMAKLKERFQNYTYLTTRLKVKNKKTVDIGPVTYNFLESIWSGPNEVTFYDETNNQICTLLNFFLLPGLGSSSRSSKNNNDDNETNGGGSSDAATQANTLRNSTSQKSIKNFSDSMKAVYTQLAIETTAQDDEQKAINPDDTPAPLSSTTPERPGIGFNRKSLMLSSKSFSMFGGGFLSDSYDDNLDDDGGDTNNRQEEEEYKELDLDDTTPSMKKPPKGSYGSSSKGVKFEPNSMSQLIKSRIDKHNSKYELQNENTARGRKNSIDVGNDNDNSSDSSRRKTSFDLNDGNNSSNSSPSKQSMLSSPSPKRIAMSRSSSGKPGGGLYRMASFKRTRRKSSMVKVISNRSFEKASTSKHWVIYPNNPYKFYWDLFMGVWILISILIIPVQIAFNVPINRDSAVFDILIDIFFFFDIIVSMFSAPSNEKITRSECMKTYLCSSTFFCDLISTIPFNEAIIFSVEGNSSVIRTTRLFKILRLFRLAKVLRIFKLAIVIDKLEYKLGIPTAVIDIVKLIIEVYIIGHFVACCWWGISGSMSDVNWYNSKRLFDNNLNQESIASQYLISIYFTFTTMTTVGYGDIFPTNAYERVLCIFVILIGVSVFGFILANVSALLDKFNITETDKFDKIGEISEYLSEKKIDHDVVNRIIDHYKNLFQFNSATNENKILSRLPQMISDKLIKLQHQKFIDHIIIFKHIRILSVQIHIFKLMKPKFYSKAKYILNEGCDATSLMFIVQGEAITTDKHEKKEIIKSESSFFGLGNRHIMSHEELSNINNSSLFSTMPDSVYHKGVVSGNNNNGTDEGHNDGVNSNSYSSNNNRYNNNHDHHIIVNEGDHDISLDNNDFHICIEGSFINSRKIRRRNQLNNRLFAGCVFGHKELFTNKPYDVSLVSETSCIVFELLKSDIQTLILANKKVATILKYAIERSIDSMNNQT